MRNRKILDDNGFYSIRYLMSFDRNKYVYRFMIGARGIGKTYQIGKLLANFYHKVKNIPEDTNNIDDLFVYYRLKPRQIDILADEVISPALQKKYKIKIKVESNKIYFNERYMGDLLALQDAPMHKGGNFSWQRYRYVIIDEFQLERRERRTFDVVYNLRSSLESVCRFTTRSKLELDYPTVLFAGNTVDDATDLLFALDFFPEKYGTYKFPKKNAIIQYIADGKEYKKAQSRNPLRVFETADDHTFGERKLKNKWNVMRYDMVGHRKFISFLHITDYIKLEVWQTQKGFLYISRGLPTKKFENRHHVLDKNLANKGTTYSIEFHKLIRKHYNENNIYFDKRITAQVFMKYIV